MIAASRSDTQRPQGAALPWEGRVEHVVSGQVPRFHSSEELLAFLRRVLREVEDPPDAW